MENLEKRVEALRQQYRIGKRWLVFDVGKKLDGIFECYFEYQDAVDGCRSHSLAGECFQICVLGSILKRFHVHYATGTKGTYGKRLKDIVGRFPIRFLHPDNEREKELLRGNFYPVIWEKVIYPLIDVSRYVILRKNTIFSLRCVTLLLILRCSFWLICEHPTVRHLFAKKGGNKRK